MRSARPCHKPSGISILVFSIFLLPAISNAASIYWDGGAGNTDWNSPNNWSNNLVPVSTDDVTIDANVTVTAGSAAPISFNSLTIGGTNTATLKLSTGTASLGALIIRNKGTLEQNSLLPLSFASVSVESGGKLTHTANTSSKLYGLILGIAGDITINPGAAITVDGLGYAGGGTAAAGYGPGGGAARVGGNYADGNGAGHGGMGGRMPDVTSGGLGYDSAVIPAEPGSGGGGAATTAYGGAGGGLIIITAGGTAYLNGAITANGAMGGYSGSYSGRSGGGGSGGTINITANIIEGSGSLRADGGSKQPAVTGGGGGGGGIISLSAAASDNFAGFRSVNPGVGSQNGGAGIIARRSDGNGYTVAVDGDGIPTGANTVLADDMQNIASLVITSATAVSNSISAGNITLAYSGILVGKTITATNDFILEPTSKLVHAANTSTKTNWLQISVGHDFNLKSGATINLDGLGYAGGGTTANGYGPGGGSARVGDNYADGNGAGHAGLGGRGANVVSGGLGYDDAVNPVDLGSGGGGAVTTAYGGAGGGLIIITAGGTAYLNGTITANGANGGYSGSYSGRSGGGGSGGTINITAGVIEGSGSLNANGGSKHPSVSAGMGGGGGIIALRAHTANNFAGAKFVNCGAGPTQSGGAGIISQRVNGAVGSDIIIDGDGVSPGTYTYLSAGAAANNVSVTTATVLCDSLSAHSLTLFPGGVLIGKALSLSGDLTLRQNSLLTHPSNFTAQLSRLDITVGGNMDVQPGAGINLDGRGYTGGAPLANGYGPGAGLARAGDNYTDGNGGGYGGLGGRTAGAASGGLAYGSLTAPGDIGSGGGGAIYAGGGAGGGALTARIDGTLYINGIITANGLYGFYTSNYDGRCGGGGAGGTVNITAGTITGAGVIRANGGPKYPAASYGAGGAGGRIAIAAPFDVFTGTISASGGAAGIYGGPGTQYINGSLLVDNVSGAGATNIAGSYTFSSLTAKNGATVNLSSPTIVTNALQLFQSTVAAGGTLTVATLTATSGSVLAALNDTLDVAVSGDMVMQPGSMITADGKGYPSATGPGKGQNGTINNSGGGGASYGGLGGSAGSGSVVYGSLTSPADSGSGGGIGRKAAVDQPGGAGGGIIKLAVGNILNLNAIVTANGAYGNIGGGGAGGSVNITAGSLSGAGAIRANGGNSGGTYPGGGGGGGRIAVFYTQKTYTGAITASGGIGTPNGSAGTIFDNGVVASPVTLPPGASMITQPQSMGSATHISESLQAQDAAFNNLVASGSYNGSITFPQFKLVKIKSGAYTDKGFAQGNWTFEADGKTYTGSFKAAAFLQNGRQYLKGSVDGGLHGSLELELAETAPNSGVYDQLNGFINYTRLGSDAVPGRLYLSGMAAYGMAQDYPPAQIAVNQAALQGSMTGDYSGPFNAVFTSLVIDDAASPHNGQGYFSASYSTNLGEAQGWAHAQRLSAGVVDMHGVTAPPMYAVLTGALNANAAPPTMLVNLEKLDNSVLKPWIRVLGPDAVSPGGTYTYTVEVHNEGSVSLQNVSVIAVAPQHMDFVTASSTYTYHDFSAWIRGGYTPIPYIRWDFAQINAGQVVNLSYQAKMRIGVISHSEELSWSAHIVPIDKADEIFPRYGEPVVDPVDWSDEQY